MTFRTAR